MDKKTTFKKIIEWTWPTLIAAIIVISVFFFARPTLVQGRSMDPCLNDNNLLLSERISISKKRVSRGEIITFDASPAEKSIYIKRIIGIPGDKVKIDDGKVYINGKQLNEPYLKEGTVTEGHVDIVVPPEEVFVLGDNRGVSNDSRYIGCIKFSKIKGHPYYRLLPFNKAGKIEKANID